MNSAPELPLVAEGFIVVKTKGGREVGRSKAVFPTFRAATRALMKGIANPNRWSQFKVVRYPATPRKAAP